MTTTMDFGERKLDLGRVAGQTFTVIGRQPLAIFGLALLLAGLPGAINLYLTRDAIAAGAAGALTQFTTFAYWARFLVMLFIGSFLGVCLFFVAFSEVSGRKVSVGEVMSSGAKLFLPLFAVNVLSFVGIGLGCALFIVPGIMLGLAWCVAGPSLVAERVGITQAFSRSAQLTRNNRWRILGLFVIAFILLAVIEGVLGAIVGITGAGGVLFSPMRLVVVAITSSVTTAITYTGIAVLYAQLRELKEGVGGEGLAAVFD
jgi:hypothetical protein